MSACSRLELQTLGSQLVIMPQNLRDTEQKMTFLLASQSQGLLTDRETDRQH